MKKSKLALLTLIVMSAISCGGGGTDYSPTAPTTTPAGGATASSGANVTVNIVGSSGSGAFSPNPASAAVGQTVAFKNNDGTMHRITANDGSLDSGDITPGATSRTMTVASGNTLNFHCTIHPTMVFALNGSAPPPAPAPNPSGGYDY